MTSKTHISFPAHNPKFTLRGWLFTPDILQTKYPAIIMLPGFSALKEHGLEAFAKVFAHAGFIVLAYDHRNFGESDKEVALEIDPHIQIKDTHAAIAYLKTHDNVDTNRIGLWGMSLAGGHVLLAAMENPSVKAIVAQVPFVRGHHDYLRKQKPEKWQALEKLYAIDKKAREEGKAPQMTQVVTDNLTQAAVLKQTEAYHFFTSVPSWVNAVTLHSVENCGDYNPIDSIDKLTTPILFIVAKQDTINLTSFALEAYEKIKAPKELLLVEGEHFAPCDSAFRESSEAALSWFLQYLS